MVCWEEEGSIHGKEQNHPLRALTEQEERELCEWTKATSERLDVVNTGRALLGVQAGRSFTEAAKEAGLKSGDGISQLVERFNRQGLAALLIARGEAASRPIRASSKRGSWPKCNGSPIESTIRRRRGRCCCCGERCARGSAAHRQRNDSPGAARGGLQLPADAHLGPHRLRAAQAQKRHGDDL